ncbi:MAG TPA: DUF4386 domain-containing protein [Bacteroidales bacterium]|nr:DUF4386 domain-containing protein [Bacteroidales bacterium]
MDQSVIIADNKNDISLRSAAIITGIALIFMALLAPVANFSILQKLFIPGDAQATMSNILNSPGSFRAATVLFLIVAVLDIIVAWGLYVLFKPVNHSLSLLTAWIRVVYATMLGVVITSLVYVIQITGGGGPAEFQDTGTFEVVIMQSLMKFNYGWEFSLIIFGFHLLLLGFLAYKAGYMKRILGILLLIAALGYLIDGFGRILTVDYGKGIGVYTFLGEIVLIFWLLIAGGRDKATN